MDRLASMAVFKRTVELGSFAAAARHFGMSPEMAGNHVRALERWLGVRLLNRSTRRLHLTEVGEGYLARCAQILTDVEEAEAQANALQTTPRGLLRIAVPVTFGLQAATPAVSAYMARYPEVNFDIAAADRFVNLIEEGFDLAIRVGPLGDSNLIARQLVSAERSIVCASPAYLEGAGRPQTPADLGAHSCLIYAETSAPDTWQFEAPDGRTETVRVAGRFTCTNAGFVREMALAGHGIVRGPSFWLSADVATGRLVPLLEPWRSPRELPVHALYPHRSLLSAKVRTFVDFLVEWFGSDSELRAPMGGARAGTSR